MAEKAFVWSTRPRRLDKYLSDAGFGPRKHLRALFANHQVNFNQEQGAPAWRLVDPLQDTVTVGDTPVILRNPDLYALMHKPPGRLTATSDPHGRAHLGDLLPPGWRTRAAHIGRLDKATTGALLWTDDGDLNWLLTTPGKDVWKHYQVTLHDPINHDDPRLARIIDMTHLDGHELLPVRIQHQDSHHLDVFLQEGRYRQVRRMIKGVGLNLAHLHRAAIGPLKLGTLPQGQTRHLTPCELRALRQETQADQRLRARFDEAMTRRLDFGDITEAEKRMIKRYLA